MLTWPQCTAPKEFALEKLKVLIPSTYIVVSEELHENGDPHLHAFMAFAEKFRTRNCRFFDLHGLGTDSLPKRWHSNIKTCPTRLRAIEYVKKDGNFIEYGTTPKDVEQEKI